jgi:hypothetical protein
LLREVKKGWDLKFYLGGFDIGFETCMVWYDFEFG